MPNIEDVYHVVDCKVNLLSVSQICDAFSDVVFKRDVCQVLDKKSNIVITGRRDHNNIYVMNATPNDIRSFSARIGDAKLWHRRLGHINYKALDILTSKGLVRGLPKLGRPLTSPLDVKASKVL